jgi:dihydroorotate dehydrogenase
MQATEIIRKLYDRLQGAVPIIGVGGIENAEDAWEKLVAGADLVQIYTALIYEGPCQVQAIARGLAERVRASGCATLAEAVQQSRRARHPSPATETPSSGGDATAGS